MASSDTKAYDLGYMDELARQDTAVHRLDPRAKLVATFFFTVAVVSFDKYTLSAMVPFLAYPIFLIAVGRIPARYLCERSFWCHPLPSCWALPTRCWIGRFW